MITITEYNNTDIDEEEAVVSNHCPYAKITNNNVTCYYKNNGYFHMGSCCSSNCPILHPDILFDDEKEFSKINHII